MDFSVTMPPEAQRDVLVDAMTAGIESDSDYSSLRAVMAHLLKTGQTPQGIHCLLLQPSTIRLVRGRLAQRGFSVTLRAALDAPIGLN